MGFWHVGTMLRQLEVLWPKARGIQSPSSPTQESNDYSTASTSEAGHEVREPAEPPAAQRRCAARASIRFGDLSMQYLADCDQNNQRFELRPCGRAGLDRQDRQGPPRTAKDLKPRHTRKSNCTALEDFVGVKVASTSASSPK